MSEPFNACHYLLDLHVDQGRGDRLAITGTSGDVTYAQLHDRVRRTAAGLRAIGLLPEQRVMMFMADSPDFAVVFLAALRIGAVPVPVSTMMRAEGLSELLRDSRARFLAVTADYAVIAAEAVAAAPELAGLLAGDDVKIETGLPVHALADLATAEPAGDPDPTSADSPAFWLYTSGTTGTPKAAMHRHGSVRVVCETYGDQILGIRPGDRCLSAAKGFFAYGLGNSLLFPFAAGATTILEPAPSRPDLLAEHARTYGATLFFAGPTFFANMLRAGLPRQALGGVRLAASAGEPLPAPLYQRWTGHFGIDILDGIGMTERARSGPARPGSGYRDMTCASWTRRAARSRPAHRAPCTYGASPPRPATGRATRRPARCSRASGCAPGTPTCGTPRATTSARAGPGTC
jgi:acyl-coenzyme A synthetase/AMP-(fatty) acid ligase